MGLTGAFVAAAVQMDIAIGDAKTNMQRIMERLHIAHQAGAHLVVFPECATSGYCYGSASEALPYALPADAPELEEFRAACRGLGVTAILGFLERTASGSLHNSALLADPEAEVPIVYRKTHLPTLGVDRYVQAGNDLPVHDIELARIGILICYDIRFPEAARVMALRRADVIALPTNWPTGGESAPEYVLRARARENGCFIVAANRTGTERGRPFIGRSQIVGPDGVILAQAGVAEETLYARIEPARARQKRIVFEPGEWEQDTVGDRRPDLYGDLSK